MEAARRCPPAGGHFRFLGNRKPGPDRRPVHQDELAWKPLTSFESFKAEFEEIVRGVSPALHRDVSKKIDNEWSDVLWRLRGLDNGIDDRFLSYFGFVTETFAYRKGQLPPRSATPIQRAKA